MKAGLQRVKERGLRTLLKEVLHRYSDKSSDLLRKIPQNMILLNIKPKPNQGFLRRLIPLIWIPIAENDRTLPLFHFRYSNPKSCDWLKRKVDFADWEGDLEISPPLLNVCGGPL